MTLLIKELYQLCKYLEDRSFNFVEDLCHHSWCSTDSLNIAKSVKPFTRTIALSSPHLSAAGGNHTTLWTLERVVSLAFLGVIPAAFLVPSQTLDALMAVSLVLHSHWGIEATITDYVRPAIVGNVLPKVSHASLLLLSMATLGGLFYLIYNDIGIAKSVKLLNLFMKNKSLNEESATK
ncbi:succinate dehydrogenase [ubiquinone] cytochrome b small subunit, mitochondrial-like [Glossina fuscipes fuscipes]